MDRDLICEICNNPYELEMRNPICIPCGHTLCLVCLKENYEKEGKVRCINDNKIFNLKPEQYAKNYFILKLIQTKKPSITNININKNFNLVNNNNININTSANQSFQSANFLSKNSSNSHQINNSNTTKNNTNTSSTPSNNSLKNSNLPLRYPPVSMNKIFLIIE